MQHLVAERQHAVGVEPELELRVGQDHAALERVLGDRRVDARSRRRAGARPARASRRARPPRARSIASSWPSSAFVEGVKIGSGSRSDSRSPAGSSMPETAPVALVVLPAGARDVAAHDALDRQHLQPLARAARGRAPRPARRRSPTGSGWGRSSRVSPNHRTERPVSTLALVGDRRGMDDVVGGDAVGGDHQQVVPEVVHLADLALGEEGRSARRHAPEASMPRRPIRGRTESPSASRSRPRSRPRCPPAGSRRSPAGSSPARA